MNTWNDILNLAKKGRRGDSRLRKVAGRVSHVNKEEAEVIDWLGPLGEAWVQRIGSGSTNPDTKLPEYFSLKKIFSPGKRNKNSWLVGENSWYQSAGLAGSTWKPNEGKWGIFGTTYKSRERDKKAAAEATRKNTFKTFVNDNKDKNIAEMYANASGGEQSVEDFMTGGTDTTLDASTMSTEDFNDVITKYDERQEDELLATTQRNIETKGSENAIGTFGLLTETSLIEDAGGLSSSGNFGAELKKGEMIKQSETEFEQVYADATSEKTDIQDGFNEQFWADAMGWSDANGA